MKGIEYALSSRKARFNGLLSSGVISPIYLGVASLLQTIDPILGAEVISQIRVGQNGLPFELLKFSQFGENGDRSNRIIRLLRRVGADELPQVLNISRGEMLTIGFRPLIPEDHEEFMDNLTPKLQQQHDRVVMPTQPGLISSYGIAAHAGQNLGPIAESAVLRAENNIKDVMDGSVSYDYGLMIKYLASPILSKVCVLRGAYVPEVPSDERFQA